MKVILLVTYLSSATHSTTYIDCLAIHGYLVNSLELIYHTQFQRVTGPLVTAYIVLVY